MVFAATPATKFPCPRGQYIIARVRNEFPETIFLLEGLGGSWEATENLLTDGGKCNGPTPNCSKIIPARMLPNYLGYANRQSSRVGTYVHYSETHDNSRLAEKRPHMGRCCATASVR